jgi:hypothetical protein
LQSVPPSEKISEIPPRDGVPETVQRQANARMASNRQMEADAAEMIPRAGIGLCSMMRYDVGERDAPSVLMDRLDVASERTQAAR